MSVNLCFCVSGAGGHWGAEIDNIRSMLAHIENNNAKPFLSVFSEHITDITQWFCTIKNSQSHAKNYIQKLTGRRLWMCVTTATICQRECQEKASTVECCICSTRKWSHFLCFRCHPFSTKVKVCWKSVVCLYKKFFADLQKPGTAAACERSERLDMLSGLSEVSQLTESVILTHILERNTITESVTLVLVYLMMKSVAEWLSIDFYVSQPALITLTRPLNCTLWHKIWYSIKANRWVVILLIEPGFSCGSGGNFPEGLMTGLRVDSAWSCGVPHENPARAGSVLSLVFA